MEECFKIENTKYRHENRRKKEDPQESSTG
jgi:hypothetical protein